MGGDGGQAGEHVESVLRVGDGFGAGVRAFGGTPHRQVHIGNVEIDMYLDRLGLGELTGRAMGLRKSA